MTVGKDVLECPPPNARTGSNVASPSASRECSPKTTGASRQSAFSWLRAAGTSQLEFFLSGVDPPERGAGFEGLLSGGDPLLVAMSPPHSPKSMGNTGEDPPLTVESLARVA